MNPYEVLGIKKTFDKAIIRKAYHNKCFENKDSSDKLRDVIDAYEIIINNINKKETDKPKQNLSNIILNISLEELLTKSNVIYKFNNYDIDIPLPGFFVKEYNISINGTVSNVYINLTNKEYKGCSFLFDKNLLLGFTVLNKSIDVDKNEYKLRRDKQSIFFDEPKVIYNFAESHEELAFPTEVDLRNKVIYFNKKGIKYLHPITNEIHYSDLLIAYNLK